MSKNKDKRKDKKLRQSIEILKAQLKDNIQIEIKTDNSAGSIKTVTKAKPSDVKSNLAKINFVEDKYIKQDLVKTVILSAGAFAAIIILWVLNITSF